MGSRTRWNPPAAAAFRTWLEGKPRERVVGRIGEAGACPLAEWLRATTGRPWLVFGDNATVASMDVRDMVLLPPWAVRFVRLVDELPQRPEYERRLRVTAGMALGCLGQAEEDGG